MQRENLKNLKSYINIYIGSFVSAIGVKAFLVPSNLAPGGATGLSVLFNYLTGIPVGVWMFTINIPLFLISLKIFGKSFGAKTFAGFSFYSINTGLVSILIPNIENLFNISSSGNIILGALYSGLFMGVGIGFVIKNGGTTGGSDIVSAIINKYFKISIGQALIIIDTIVTIGAAFVFGAEKAMYALISLYITGIVINKMITGLGNAKMAHIITSNVEEVRYIIVNVLGKTGNLYEASSLYTQNKKNIITTVLKNREIFLLKELIMKVDSEAFVVVSDVHEVLGRGYTFGIDEVAKYKKEEYKLNEKFNK